MNTPPNPDDGTRGRGRPPKLTPELLARVAELLINGNFRGDVARAVGIGVSTFRRWMAQGRTYPEGVYGHFRAVVLKSEGAFKTRAVAQIVSAGNDDPWLMLAFLERKYPRQFGKYRGELGELKRRVKEMERMVESLGGDGSSDQPNRRSQRRY